MSIFKGSGTAIVTPFDAEGNVSYDVFGELIEFQIENKTDALIVCGTTGESSTLNDEEHIEVIRYAVEKVNKRIPVIAGTGSNDTKHGIDLSVDAEKAGADGLLLVTPYYNKTSQRGLIDHYTTIAKEVDIPIILYNVPGRTGLNILPETALELSKVDNIVALKEASANITQVAKIAHLCGDRLDLYSGCDELIVPVMSLGGSGVISVLANICPLDTHNMVMHYLNGDVAKATELQLKLIPLIDQLFSEVNPIPVKAALYLLGFNAGILRKPLVKIGEENFNSLKKAMKDYGLI